MKYILASSLIIWTSCAVAIPCTSTYETCDALPIMLTGCELGQTYSPGCIGGTTTRYVSCNSCKTGYIRVLTSGVASSGCTYDYYKCQPDEEEECNENTNCISDTSWSAASVGYEKKLQDDVQQAWLQGKKNAKKPLQVIVARQIIMETLKLIHRVVFLAEHMVVPKFYQKQAARKKQIAIYQLIPK